MGVVSFFKSLLGVEEKKEIDYKALTTALKDGDMFRIQVALNGNPWEEAYQRILNGGVEGLQTSDALTFYKAMSDGVIPEKAADNFRHSATSQGEADQTRAAEKSRLPKNIREIVDSGPGGTRSGMDRGKK